MVFLLSFLWNNFIKEFLPIEIWFKTCHLFRFKLINLSLHFIELIKQPKEWSYNGWINKS